VATEHYEVIIIGTGAGGGTLAHTLAPSGRKLLLLERGDFLPRELQNWDPKAVFQENRYISKETWLDADGRPFQPQVHYFVGGATKVYGASLYRLRPQDFGDVRHIDGVSPAWPLGYDDFEPYYSKAEWLYQIHGNRGEDPTEGYASKPYPWPAVSNEPRMAALMSDLAAAGYHPFHAPCGILLDEADPPRSACIRCKWCDGYPCLVHAKSDAEVLAVRPILDMPNVTLLVGAEVVKLETADSGRTVTKVIVERRGVREEYASDVVVVSAGAANSAKLLLRSANDAHPQGLANGSGQVGRNYMFHNCAAVMAVSLEKNPTVFQKTLALNDFYFGERDFAYPMGNIQMVGKSLPPMYRGERPRETALAPEFTLQELSDHSVDFWLTTEDLPRPENRITVAADGTIALSYQPTNREEFARLFRRLETMLGGIGMRPHRLLQRNHYFEQDVPIAGVGHQVGTCRFGVDPATTVLDLTCRAHEIDNLYVVDTSFFPSIGAVNPALTAMANAIRVGEHLAERLRGGAAP
jgi:choline dehydrogenase-like flavoprotein